MGLNVVQLVIRCEEFFAIELRDDDMERVQTVGDLYAAVCNELRLTPHPNPTITRGWTRIAGASLNPSAWTAEDVWATLQTTVINQLQVKA